MRSILALKDVTKIYKLYSHPKDRLIELFFRVPRHREVRALEEISFELPQGKSLGLVGVNGAGKSTLLKILSGTTHPSYGEVVVQGRVAAILELGMGFHGEFSGWDNAIMNASLLGLSPKEIDRALPRIRDFSELGDFLYHPVKTYSSGMVMRLAFAVATHVDPDILIIDEALAVGDGYFQKKCVDKIRSFRERGKTILLCSHALYYISQLCDDALWLDQGKIRKFGRADEIVHDYENFLMKKQEEEGSQKKDNIPAYLDRVYHTWDEQSKTLSLKITWRSKDLTLGFRPGFVLDHTSGLPIFSTLSDKVYRGKEKYEISLTIEKIPLQKGEYDLVVFLMDEAGLSIFDEWRQKGAWKIHPQNYAVGLMDLPHRWSN